MNDLNNLDLLDIAESKLASKSFIDFIKKTKPDYQTEWFHLLLAEHLQDFAAGIIKKLMIFMPPQHGKFLDGNTPVLTTKGWILHKNLKVGDFVFNDLGVPVKVLWNSGIYNWFTNIITFAGNESLICANEHLWKIQVDYDNHKGRQEVIQQTKDIFAKKHRRAPFIKLAPCLKTAPKDLLINPYLLGVWLGDGNSRNSYITCGEQDIKHFSFLGKVTRERTKENQFRILPFGEITTKLRKLGLLKNKHIPIDYILSSKNQRIELLKGLMDTDGFIDKKGRCEFTQKSGKLAKDVYVLLRTLGYKPTIYEYDMKLNNKIVGKKMRVCFSPNKNDIVFGLDRKQSILKNKIQSDRNDKYKLFIKKIEPNKNVLGNCIEVEGGMYLAGHELIPTHNSEQTSRRLPAYLLGLNPNNKIVGATYGDDLSKSFNRDVQRIISDPIYSKIFPETKINSKNIRTDAQNNYLRNADIFEIIDKRGFYKSVTIGGSLTGTPCDIGIIDDPVKDKAQADSPAYRDKVWDWYLSVFLTRLHNDSQILLTMTRWNIDDLAGRILANETEAAEWTILKLPALLEGTEKHPKDPRNIGEVLWEKKHSKKKILKQKAASETIFHSVYQQDPQPFKGGLVFTNWTTVDKFPEGGYSIFGLDFGYNAPSVLIEVRVYDNRFYIRQRVFKTKLTNPKLIELCEEIEGIKDCLLYPDSAEPDRIDEFKEANFKVIPAVKTIKAGILFIKENPFYVYKSPDIIKELGLYRYPFVNGEFLDTPLDDNNHSLDAFRYAVYTHFKANAISEVKAENTTVINQEKTQRKGANV